MQADHVLRAGRGVGNRVDVQVGGVGGQHGAGLADAVQFLEHGLLDFQVFEHGLNHQVHVLQVVVAGRSGVARHDGGLALFGQAALGDQAVVDLFHIGLAPGDGLGIALDHDHGVAGVQRRHGDAGAHGAATDDGQLGKGTRCGGLGFGDLGGLALGEEGMDQALALGAFQALHEQGALMGQALLERQVHGGLGALDDLQRREQATRLLGGVDGQGFQLGQGPDLVGDLDVAGAAHWGAGRQQAAGIGQAGGGHVVTVHQLVHQTRCGSGLGRQVLAAEHQLGGGLHAHHARGTLGAAGAGQQAKVHFGQAQQRLGQCQAVVGRQRNFQATAQGGAVDGGHHQLGAGFNRVADLGQRGGHGGLAEFTDVGAGDEGLALTDDQQGLHGRIGRGLFHGGQQTGAHGLTQCIDGGVVDADHQHLAIEAGLDHRSGVVGTHARVSGNRFSGKSRLYYDKGSLQSPQ